MLKYKMSEELEEDQAMKWKMFMCHLPQDKISELEEELLKQEIGGYVICNELEPYSHYHFLVQMNNTEYHNYKQRVFIEKYKLRGRATKNQPRQYGQTASKIRDIEKAKSYTIKMCKNTDLTTGPLNQILRTNLSSEEIESAYENSFKKKDLETQKKKIIEELESKNWKDISYQTIDYNYELKEETYKLKDQIEDRIIDILLRPQIDISFSKTSRDALYYRFIKQSKKFNKRTKIQLIKYK